MFNQEKVLKMIHVNLLNFYDETSKSLNQFVYFGRVFLFVIHLDDFIILAPWFCAIQIFRRCILLVGKSSGPSVIFWKWLPFLDTNTSCIFFNVSVDLPFRFYGIRFDHMTS